MIEEKKADQVFMSVDNMRAKEFLQLLDSMPQEFIDLTQHIVQYAEKLKLKSEFWCLFYLDGPLEFCSRTAQEEY